MYVVITALLLMQPTVCHGFVQFPVSSVEFMLPKKLWLQFLILTVQYRPNVSIESAISHSLFNIVHYVYFVADGFITVKQRRLLSCRMCMLVDNDMVMWF